MDQRWAKQSVQSHSLQWQDLSSSPGLTDSEGCCSTTTLSASPLMLSTTNPPHPCL